MNWLVQNNLIKEEVTGAFEGACAELGHTFIGCKIVPFTDSVEYGFYPGWKPPTGKFIPYGSTSMIKMLDKANLPNCFLFFDYQSLKTTEWINRLGDKILNCDAKLMTLKEAMNLQSGTYFMKPDDDLKDFTGSIVDAEGIKKFYDEVSAGGFCFSPNINVILSSVKNTGFEYRFFMIEDRIVDCSSYKIRSIIDIREPVPQEAKDFAVKVAKQWRPDDVYVMDLVDVGGEFKIVEFNCFNASGFYNCSVKKIVDEVSQFVEETYT